MTGFQGETACRRARHAGAIGLLWAIIVMVFVPAQSVAQIVIVTGQIEVVTIPPSLLGGVFDEMRIILGNYVPDGDVNVDGFVDVEDILLGIQAALGNRLLSTEEFGHGDVAPLVSNVPTPNGDFGLPDVLLIMRKVMGLVSF